MQIFSLNACLIGLILALFIILFNWVYVLFAIWRKIKIEEVHFLYGNKALLRADVKGVKFRLNWIPFGTSVKLLGLGYMDDEELEKIQKEDLPFAFFNQPFWVRTLFRMLPSLLYLAFVLGIVAIGVDFSSFVNFLRELGSFYFALKGFDEFAVAVAAFTSNHSQVIFALLFLNLIATFQMTVNALLTQAMGYFIKKKSAMSGVFTTLMFLTSGWMLYKMVGFAGAYFGYLQLLLLNVNMLFVILVVTVVLFFAMLPLFRMVLPDGKR